MTFLYVVSTPCCCTVSSTLRTWYVRALPCPPLTCSPLTPSSSRCQSRSGRTAIAQGCRLDGTPELARQGRPVPRFCNSGLFASSCPSSVIPRRPWTARCGTTTPGQQLPDLLGIVFPARLLVRDQAQQRLPAEHSCLHELPANEHVANKLPQAVRTHARRGAPKEALGRCTISAGSQLSAASLRAAFCFRPRIFSWPGIENAARARPGSRTGHPPRRTRPWMPDPYRSG